jgi:hypothetical protein
MHEMLAGADVGEGMVVVRRPCAFAGKLCARNASNGRRID